MSTRNRLSPLILLSALAVALVASGCGGDSAGPGVDLSTFDGVVEYGGVYEKVQPEETVTTLESVTETASDGTILQCTTQRYSIVDAPTDYATFDPNAEVIYPGNMLQGATLGDATPSPIVVDRAPGTITINLVNGSTIVSQDVDEIKFSTVIGAMNQIIQDNSGEVPAGFTYNFSEVQSREQMALNMGVNFKSLTTGVKAKLSFSSDQEYNRFLVELNQRYYTMSYDLPTSTDDLFASSVTPADLARYVAPGNPATYISSVTYGRRFYLLVESTSSVRDMRASIDASYSAALAGGSAHLDGTYVKDLSNVNIKLFALGGDANSALATFNGDIDQVANFLTTGGSITNGVPLSYTIRNVHDNTLVAVKVATDYEVKTCTVQAVGSYYEDFESGLAGWSGYADLGSVRVLNTSSSISGYYLAGNDLATGGTGYFRAPLAWGGDWSHFYGGKASYYLFVGGGSTTTPFNADDLVIYGKNGTRLAARWVNATYVPTNGFFLMQIEINESNFKINGATGTRAELEDALTDVTDVFIRGEYYNGKDWGAIDEVRIETAAP